MKNLLAVLIMLAIPALIVGGLWMIHPGLAMVGAGVALLWFAAVAVRRGQGRRVEDALASVERATNSGRHPKR